MSHPPSDPALIPQSYHDSLSAPEHTTFIVRLWRRPADGVWRCRLIHVETGQHLPCDHLDEVGERIERWLQGVERGKGLR